MNPGRAFAELPAGWARGRVLERASIHCGSSAEEVAGVLAAFFGEGRRASRRGCNRDSGSGAHPFERAVVEGDLEVLHEFSTRHERTGKNRLQLALL